MGCGTSRILRKVVVKTLHSAEDPAGACTWMETWPVSFTGLGKGRPMDTPEMEGVGVMLGVKVIVGLKVMVGVRVMVGESVMVGERVGVGERVIVGLKVGVGAATLQAKATWSTEKA